MNKNIVEETKSNKSGTNKVTDNLTNIKATNLMANNPESKVAGESNNDLTEQVINDGLSNADLENMRDGENDPESKTSTQSINVEPNTQ